MKHISILTVIAVLVLGSLACSSLQVGIMTPTPDNFTIDFVNNQVSTPEVVAAETSLPTTESTDLPEDFSHLWVEYRNPVLNYGLAFPSYWEIETETEGGFMIAKSYDLDFFQANSIKGNWIGSEPPEGAVKLDFVPFEGVNAEQSLADAISEILGSDPEMTVVLSVEDIPVGSHNAVRISTARPDNLEDKTSNIAFRISPETILFVAAYPYSGHQLSDVQTILSSLVLDKNTPVVKPTTEPQPPLTVKNTDLSGMPTASYPFAWYGHIASLPDNASFEDKVVLMPLGSGEFGIKGGTLEIEEKIQSLRDASGEREYVHLWGVLYCNIDDYNTCQLNVERLEYGDQYTRGNYPVENWVGTIKSTTFKNETAYALVLSGAVPVWYGIGSNNDPIIQEQIENLADTDTIVSVSGDLLVGVQDVNGTRLEVHSVNPPGPGGLPSSAVCDSGYMGVLEETVGLITDSLESGNYYPLSYTIGNPFVIGYWRSEGVTIPREEAFQQLTDQFLPSPENVVVFSNPADFPDLEGVSLENVWGPDVVVAANLYSTGWGPDGQSQAILSIAQCMSSSGQIGYYWFGMLYGGFE